MVILKHIHTLCDTLPTRSWVCVPSPWTWVNLCDYLSEPNVVEVTLWDFFKARFPNTLKLLLPVSLNILALKTFSHHVRNWLPSIQVERPCIYRDKAKEPEMFQPPVDRPSSQTCEWRSFEITLASPTTWLHPHEKAWARAAWLAPTPPGSWAKFMIVFVLCHWTLGGFVR